MQFIFLFGSVLGAALGTMALRSLPTQRTTETLSGFRRVLRQVWLQVRGVRSKSEAISASKPAQTVHQRFLRLAYVSAK